MEENTRGGARIGAGRKPKIDEITLIESMDGVLVPKTVWISLSEKVKAGDTNAIKTWLQYRYGMPKQIIESKNINIDAGKLTDEEIVKINDQLNQLY
jgi:hypothetical protein